MTSCHFPGLASALVSFYQLRAKKFIFIVIDRGYLCIIARETHRLLQVCIAFRFRKAQTSLHVHVHEQTSEVWPMQQLL